MNFHFSRATIQTSPALIVVPLPGSEGVDAEVGVYEFLSKSFIRCSVNMLYWLSYFKNGRSIDQAETDHPDYPQDTLRREVAELTDSKVVAAIGSAQHAVFETYKRCWEWDLTTALYHFTVMDNEFMSDEAARQKQLDRLVNETPPPFYWEQRREDAIPLPDMPTSESTQLFEVIKRRRTNRTSQGKSINLEQLSSCLQSGLGIVGTIKATSGDVPLTTTPSGGARNPFEAYVIVRRCDDLAAGVYHYCAANHSLELVQAMPTEAQLAGFFAGQTWVDDMAVVVVLVAIFERTMWKYEDPNAYRVILIQAGHIGQNIMLMATQNGLTACPTAALAHSNLAELFQLENKMLHVPVYAMTLDEAMPYPETVTPLQLGRKPDQSLR
jgi:SagB-type dehydrogenase family enzyme